MPDQSESRESQRRQATVLFADISSFTAMLETLDPEIVTEVMNDCFAMIERIVRERGGIIDKYIGDAVMALFGADQALENAARRAVAASLEIRSGLERFNSERRLPVPLQVHIGINSGLVIAGEVGGQVKRDFTVMGDTVNLAARLEGASEKGQIFVGRTTWAATRDEFEYRKLKPLSLKGKAEPVQAYEVLGPKEKVPLPKLGAATRQISSEIVGRERELAALRERISRFLSGEGGVVSIQGEAGIGKSRLLAEISGTPELGAAAVLCGRADSVGSGLSFHPFVDLLRDWAEIKGTDDDAGALAKLDTALASLVAGGKDEILPFVGTLMGLRLTGAHAERVRGIEGEALEALIVKAMNDLVGALCLHHPAVLLFEDLHWADLSSVKLLEALLHLSVEHALLFIFAFRPGFDETSRRIAAAARERLAERSLEIALEPLDDRQSETLLQNLLQIENLPYATRELIKSKAEGNPFYIEEVVRALIDQGAVESREGGLVVTDRIESVTVPGTIQEVILTRVERLDPQAQSVLQIGSVIGRNFFHRLLVELTGRPDAELEPVIALLKEREVILEQRVRRTASVRRYAFAAEREYVFKHALIRETVYQSLLNRTRKELHLRAAEAIERIFAEHLDDFYAMLAYHYGQAESLEKAEEYLFKAGEEAARAAASSEALAFFREASRVYFLIHGEQGDPKKKALLERNIGAALMVSGNLIEAGPHFDHALEYLGERVPKTPFQLYWRVGTGLAEVLFRLYVLGGRMSRRPATPETREILSLIYNRARAESTTDPERFFFDSMYSLRRVKAVDPRTVDEAFAQYAGVSLLFAFSGVSFAISRRFLEVARSLVRDDRPADQFTYRSMRLMCDYLEGAWDRPSEIDDAMLERIVRVGQLWDAEMFLGIDAEQQIDLGHFDTATKRIGQICELIDGYGYRFAEGNRDALTTLLALAQRRLPEALEAVARYAERPEQLLNLYGLGLRAKIETLQGEHEKAAATLERGEKLLTRIGRATPYHSGHFRLARLLLDVAELDRALGRGDAAAVRAIRSAFPKHAKLALATAAKLARIRTETYRLLGTHQWLAGSHRRALAWWKRSIAEGERLGARPELARTHAEMARRMLVVADPSGRADGSDVEASLDKAAQLFTEMNLIADLRDIEGLRQRRRAA